MLTGAIDMSSKAIVMISAAIGTFVDIWACLLKLIA